VSKYDTNDEVVDHFSTIQRTPQTKVIDTICEGDTNDHKRCSGKPMIPICRDPDANSMTKCASKRKAPNCKGYQLFSPSTSVGAPNRWP
jgi:hypothetical protein